jgi:beta-galactosidase
MYSGWAAPGNYVATSRARCNPQTCGVRTTENYNSEFLDEVFTYNDFGWPLKPPNHPRFLNTEFVGHTFPTKTIDAYERQMEHVIRHAPIHDTLASDPRYAGGLGWCALDYTTHDSFGSGDRILLSRRYGHLQNAVARRNLPASH